MRQKRTRTQAINDAAKAHTSLCLFEKAAEIVEGSDVDARYFTASQHIAALCRKVEQRCLRDYDRFVVIANR